MIVEDGLDRGDGCREPVGLVAADRCGGFTLGVMSELHRRFASEADGLGGSFQVWDPVCPVRRGQQRRGLLEAEVGHGGLIESGGRDGQDEGGVLGVTEGGAAE
jgi:hypothetical protein